MSKPKQVFSIRIDPEILLKIRRLAKGGRTTIGAIVRESLDGFLKSKEEADESNHRKNRFGGGRHCWPWKLVLRRIPWFTGLASGSPILPEPEHIGTPRLLATSKVETFGG